MLIITVIINTVVVVVGWTLVSNSSKSFKFYILFLYTSILIWIKFIFYFPINGKRKTFIRLSMLFTLFYFNFIFYHLCSIIYIFFNWNLLKIYFKNFFVVVVIFYFLFCVWSPPFIICSILTPHECSNID